MKCNCLCMAVRWVHHCVCIYRCIHLKELTVCWCYNITDAGISVVIRHCNQLRLLHLEGLEHITGMCALCEDPEPTLCFITLWCTISLQQVHHWSQRPNTGPYCEPYNSVYILINFSLILHCIACCIQIHPITIHISKNFCCDLLCFPQSVKYIFYWPSSINFPMQSLIQNNFIVIFFYHFQHLPTFLAKIVSVNSSHVPP